MTNNQETARKLTGAAGVIMIATFISRITGFLRNILITTNMLPRGYSDEFILAFTLPDLVYDLLAGGAIAAAMIPILSSYLTKKDEKTGWKAVSTFMNATIVIMVILEIIFFVFTDGLLGILAAGYNENATGDKALLIRLTRILLLSAPFMMMAGQLNGILYSYKRFSIAAFGPVIYNIFTIISIAVFGSKSAELTSWGVVFAAAIFFAVQFVATFKHFRYYRPKLFLRSKAFLRLVHLALPSLVSSTIIEINLIISKGYATYFDKGLLTLLNNANRTWQLPLGIFAQSIGTALLPTLSERHASESYDEFKGILYKGLKVVFLLSLPTSLIMMVMSQDIMRVLFKWGGTETEVFYGGICLLGYSAALVFASTGALMTRAFYAIHDSRTPLISGLIQIVFNYILNGFFIRNTNIGIAGTALSYSISSFVNMMIILLAFKKKTGVDIIADNFGYVFKSIAAVIPAGLVTYGLGLLIRPDTGSKISQIFALTVPVMAGLGLFWLTLIKLGIPEVNYINNLIMSKIKGASWAREQ